MGAFPDAVNGQGSSHAFFSLGPQKSRCRGGRKMCQDFIGGNPCMREPGEGTGKVWESHETTIQVQPECMRQEREVECKHLGLCAA